MLVLRVLKDGVPIREHLFRSLPIRIGRSSECDFVLTDPSVSRDHAQIEQEEFGPLQIVDLSGTNGLYAGPKRVASEPIVGRLRARLGLAEIEIEEVGADATQPVTLEDLHRLDQRRTPLTWVKYMSLAVLALVFEAVLNPEFWSPWNSQRAVSLVWLSASALVGMLIVSSILLGLLKAAGRKVRIADVFKHFAVFMWLRPLALALGLLAYYFTSSPTGSALRSWLPAFAVVAFFTYGAAIRRPEPNRGFRAFWAVALLLMMLGVEMTQSYAARRMGQPSFDHSAQVPIPGAGAGPAVSFDEYAAAVEAAGRRSEDQVR
jgi:hypothetical protein